MNCHIAVPSNHSGVEVEEKNLNKKESQNRQKETVRRKEAERKEDGPKQKPKQIDNRKSQAYDKNGSKIEEVKRESKEEKRADHKQSRLIERNPTEKQKSLTLCTMFVIFITHDDRKNKTKATMEKGTSMRRVQRGIVEFR